KWWRQDYWSGPQNSSEQVPSPHFTSLPHPDMPRHSAFKGRFGRGIYCRRQRYQRASTRSAAKIVLLTRREPSAVGLSTLAATNSITQLHQYGNTLSPFNSQCCRV